MSIAATTAKCLLFLFNIMFLITGLTVTVSAFLIEKMLWEHSTFVGNSVITPSMVIMIIGLAICVISLFGCCGVIKESRSCLIMFSGLLLVVFLLELGVGAYGYVKSNDLQAIVSKNMHKTMEEYDHNDGITRSWDILQHDFQCCGTKNMTEWESILKKLPASCCEELPIHETCTKTGAFKQGCYNVFADFLDSKSCQLATIAIGISMAQLLSVLVSLLLARHVNRYYESV